MFCSVQYFNRLITLSCISLSISCISARKTRARAGGKAAAAVAAEADDDGDFGGVEEAVQREVPAKAGSSSSSVSCKCSSANFFMLSLPALLPCSKFQIWNCAPNSAQTLLI